MANPGKRRITPKGIVFAAALCGATSADAVIADICARRKVDKLEADEEQVLRVSYADLVKEGMIAADGSVPDA